MQSRRKTIFATTVLAATWVAVVSFGLRSLALYENTPGQVGAVPESWPSASHVPRASDKATLIMFVHPRCPCTRASISELAQIIAHIREKVSARVIFLKPENSASDWNDTDLMRSAAQIPGVRVSMDLNGAEARRFGARTSGFTLLFDANGHRLFAGGITAARGHAGDNVGESSIVSLVNDHTAERARTHVFGCAMIDPTRRQNKALCSKQTTN